MVAGHFVLDPGPTPSDRTAPPGSPAPCSISGPGIDRGVTGLVPGRRKADARGEDRPRCIGQSGIDFYKNISIEPIVTPAKPRGEPPLELVERDPLGEA